MGCATGEGQTKVKSNAGVIAADTSTANETKQEAEVINIENTNQAIPLWCLFALGGGVFCFALIIPSPFKLKGF